MKKIIIEVEAPSNPNELDLGVAARTAAHTLRGIGWVVGRAFVEVLSPEEADLTLFTWPEEIP